MNAWQRIKSFVRRWRQSVHVRLSDGRNVMRLLMKPRNGEKWTTEERSDLRRDLSSFSKVIPMFVLLVVPGGKLLLPAYAWLLDRRKDDPPKELSEERRAAAALAAGLPAGQDAPGEPAPGSSEQPARS